MPYTLIVDDKRYRLEFRHITKLGKRAQLHRGSVQAVTTAVLTPQPPDPTKVLGMLRNVISVPDFWPDEAQRAEIARWLDWHESPDRAREFTAIDVTLCVDGDKFSRREGRRRAFTKLLDHCQPLRLLKSSFLVEFAKLDPDPPEQPKGPAKEKLSAERRAELKAAGQLGKLDRRMERRAKKREAVIARVFNEPR